MYESHFDLAVGHFDGDRLDVSFQSPACFDPNIEVFELASLYVEREYALARPSNAFKGFCEMQFHQVFSIGHRP